MKALLGITGPYDQATAMEYLGQGDFHELPGLIAALMVHHLRLAGQIEAVSRETAALQVAR